MKSTFRLVWLLLALSSIALLHACSAEDTTRRPSTSSVPPSRPPAIDPRALFRIGDSIMTGPDAMPCRLRFTNSGVELARSTDGARGSLRLASIGRAGAKRVLATAKLPILDASRVTYASADVIEWYEPKLEGLEQGFTIAKRPSGSGDLEIDVGLGDDLEAIALPESGAIDLRRTRGEHEPLFRYGELVALDATHANVPARMEARGTSGIRIRIDDTNAKYPITIDPLVWALQSKLALLASQALEYFGAIVAVSGDVILGSANGHDDFLGGAGLFRRSGEAWTQEKMFEYEDVPVSRNYGVYVAIDGDTALLSSSHAGTVAVKSAGGWTTEAILSPPFAPIRSVFPGNPGALRGNIAVLNVARWDATVLADGGFVDGGADGGPETEGALFIWERTGTTWTLKTTLPHPYLVAHDSFTRVVLDGDTIAVGIGFHVLVYRRAADGTWGLEAMIPQQPGPNIFPGVFGYSLALAGDTLLAANGIFVEAYTRSGTTWKHEQQVHLPTLLGSAGVTGLAITGDTMFVGDPLLGGTGGVFRYRRVGSKWAVQESIAPADITTGSNFGIDVAASGTTAAFGAPFHASNRGAVYAYTIKSSLGESCSASTACASGHCVDGVCCDTSCGGGDPQACVACNGAMTRGTCAPAAKDTVCRRAASTCDQAEVCDGVARTCPADQVKPNGSACAGGSCVAGDCITREAPASSSTPNVSPPALETSGCAVVHPATSRSPAILAAAIVVLLGARRANRRRARSGGGRVLLVALFASLLDHTRAPSLRLESREVQARFTAAGATFGEGDDEHASTMRLEAMGRRELDRVIEVEPRRAGARIVYERGSVIEWYEANAKGIEQGFDVLTRPTGEGQLVLRIRADVESHTHDSLTFASTLRYGDVHASDASGRTLASSLHTDGQTIEIEIDDRDAAYPIVVDPLVWRERDLVTSVTNKPRSSFGQTVRVAGERAFIASPFGPRFDVFRRSGTAWVPESEVTTLPILVPWSRYGYGQAIDGDTLAIGAWGEPNFSGRVFMYERSGSEWLPRATLPATPVFRAAFGFSVALDGDTLVVGAPGEGLLAVNSLGAAYVYTRTNGVWTQRVKLTGDAEARQFGGRVALRGSTLVIAATNCDLSVGFRGARLFFYTGAGDTWTLEHVATDPEEARLGCDLAVDAAGTVAAGGPLPSSTQIKTSSFVDVYTKVAGAWSPVRVHPSDTSVGDRFGVSIRLDGDRLAAGASGGDGGKGAAYLFERANGAWTQRQRFVASDGAVDDRFGESVDFTNDMLLVGAPERNVGTGAVYTFFLGLQGDGCTNSSVCASGFCIDGVCCDTECGGGSPNDCQACSVKFGAAKDGVCGPAKGNICRDTRDECDVAEKCDGERLACPADVTEPNGKACKGGVCAAGRCVPIAAVNASDAGLPTASASDEGNGCATSNTSTSNAFLLFLVIVIVTAARRRRFLH